MTNLAALADFISELDKLKAVKRQIRLPADGDRQENSAEHSWHVALMATVLADYAAHDVDMTRVVQMILIHDLVEIDAGDMFAFASDAHHEAQEAREQEAADRIFGLLPAESARRFRALWQEFEDAATADARFAKSMDRLLPVFQNMRANGGSWKRHGITRDQILRRNAELEHSAPALWNYVQEQTALAVDKGYLLAEEPAASS
ncbi:HD domain-containing protein [Alteromonas sp. ASW11-19]|uniref:HD domain-containing protein n=1 Tax=Alteromonas salexigens TaxID=2982530 RepID=A0ABT2VIS7_9ALTE|nr:HD domain-containing protein [Alteromonas salexigens]MCU7553053.1 HD domain-containing protein [Alteromonas salexigens]